MLPNEAEEACRVPLRSARLRWQSQRRRSIAMPRQLRSRGVRPRHRPDATSPPPLLHDAVVIAFGVAFAVPLAPTHPTRRGVRSRGLSWRGLGLSDRLVKLVHTGANCRVVVRRVSSAHFAILAFGC